jgi:hypothetical protein
VEIGAARQFVRDEFRRLQPVEMDWYFGGGGWFPWWPPGPPPVPPVPEIPGITSAILTINATWETWEERVDIFYVQEYTYYWTWVSSTTTTTSGYWTLLSTADGSRYYEGQTTQSILGEVSADYTYHWTDGGWDLINSDITTLWTSLVGTFTWTEDVYNDVYL